MSHLYTGRTYELRSTPVRLLEVWPVVKDADPKAVIVTAASDDIGVIGTNDQEAFALGKQKLG
ncbi:hypothetical protein [Azospirillum doebereinerae]|uniref:Uncharacterized protein n=1 Tax=Azospirillum doebereinerae TaxID=92933 RepID=A0A433J6C6_9PROT|nr:hypothetical protein [Azospirillum doebereinerae]MCG5240567.1 hypothetical protein [Azospirillum doebereinerae]RUQ68453.1 hypothetical protein EJ913_17645 [Azospirillum doebereinerae]